MSYDPITRLVYIPTYDDVANPTGYQNQASGRLVAWDPVTESARWTVPQPLSTNSGVLSTAGNLVFQGQGTGEFDAYSADRGRRALVHRDRLGDRLGARDLHGRTPISTC